MLPRPRRRRRRPRRQLLRLRRRRRRALGPARLQAHRRRALPHAVANPDLQRIRKARPPHPAAARGPSARPHLHRLLRHANAKRRGDRRLVVALHDSHRHHRHARREPAARHRAALQADVDALARLRRRVRRQRAAERTAGAARGGAAVKLTLIRPNLGDYRSTDAMPPLALGILAARARGCDVAFYDEKAEPLPKHDTPDLVALSVETFTARRAYAIADGYRARGVPVVMGGYHPTFLPAEALQHADAVVVGDAEGAWEEVLAGRRGIVRGDNNRTLADTRIDRTIYEGKKYAPIELVQY